MEDVADVVLVEDVNKYLYKMGRKGLVYLDVPLIKQKSPYDCSIACGLMLLNYCNKNIKYNKFFVKRDNLKRVNIFDLARSLKKEGVDPTITFFNYSFFDDSNFLSQIKTMPKKEIFTSIKECVSENIHIRHKIFFIKDIENLIINKKPIITLVSVQELRRRKLKKWKGHFILITGFDDRYFYYNDPSWEDQKFGKHKIEKEALTVAIYRTNFPAILWVENGS